MVGFPSPAVSLERVFVDTPGERGGMADETPPHEIRTRPVRDDGADMTRIHEFTRLLFDPESGEYAARVSVEYQPETVVLDDRSAEALIPETGAAEAVAAEWYDELTAVLFAEFDDADDPPMVVTVELNQGSVTVGSFR